MEEERKVSFLKIRIATEQSGAGGMYPIVRACCSALLFGVRGRGEARASSHSSHRSHTYPGEFPCWFTFSCAVDLDFPALMKGGAIR